MKIYKAVRVSFRRFASFDLRLLPSSEFCWGFRSISICHVLYLAINFAYPVLNAGVLTVWPNFWNFVKISSKFRQNFVKISSKFRDLLTRKRKESQDRSEIFAYFAFNFFLQILVKSVEATVQFPVWFDTFPLHCLHNFQNVVEFYLVACIVDESTGYYRIQSVTGRLHAFNESSRVVETLTSHCQNTPSNNIGIKTVALNVVEDTLQMTD